MPENTEPFDLAVIGAGPGGYVCAIKAAQLGLKVALVEKDKNLGGTCLNVGCIPSKALLHSTEQFHFAAHQGAAHGIVTGGVKLDLAALMKRKSQVVDSLRKGVQTLVAKRGITVYNGFGKITAPGEVEILRPTGGERFQAKNIVVATGSKPAALPDLPFDGKTVVSSDEAIAFDAVPGKLVVVGGGAIGLELGSVWARVGSEVTIVEFLPHIAAFLDPDITKLAARTFKKQGLAIETGAKVTAVEKKPRRKRAQVTVEQKGKTSQLDADKVLVSVGRVPSNEGLGLEELGVEMDRRRVIAVDADYQTNVPGIYAIGDTIPGPMLAHKAEEEGVALAEKLAGHAHCPVNYEAVPNVVYTEPELASVGIGEAAAKERGTEVVVGKFPLAANGRAIASDATDGLVKVIADAKTDRLLGVQIFARNASELIAAAVAHMEYGGSAEDLGRTMHAHPTLSEALKEAALAAGGGAIHAL